MVDCAGGKYYNEGCNGGFMTNAFFYVKDHGISKLSDYQYTGKDEKCKGSRNTAQIKVKDIYQVTQTEDSLKQVVGKYSDM